MSQIDFQYSGTRPNPNRRRLEARRSAEKMALEAWVSYAQRPANPHAGLNDAAPRHESPCHASRRPWSGLIAFALLALFLAGLTYGISWKEEPSLPEIIHLSSLAFRGQIVDMAVHQLQGPNALEPDLYSEITLRVDKAYRGTREGEIVTLRQVGGIRSDGYWTDIAGLYHYSVGEDVVIFHNDHRQPVFATLFGDHGLRRLATLSDGRQVVMTQQGSPVLYDDGVFSIGEGQCLPHRQDPRFCEVWVDEDGEPVEEPAQGLEVEKFDALVEAELATRPDPSLTPQRLQNDATFRTALERFFTRLDTASPPRERDGHTSSD